MLFEVIWYVDYDVVSTVTINNNEPQHPPTRCYYGILKAVPLWLFCVACTHSRLWASVHWSLSSRAVCRYSSTLLTCMFIPPSWGRRQCRSLGRVRHHIRDLKLSPSFCVIFVFWCSASIYLHKYINIWYKSVLCVFWSRPTLEARRSPSYHWQLFAPLLLSLEPTKGMPWRVNGTSLYST